MRVAVTLALTMIVLGQNNRSTWDGVYTAAQAQRGGSEYEKYCASCHGQDLQGGEMAPALKGPEFSSNWNGMPMRDIFDRVRTTMPAGADAGSLSRQQVGEIVSFILRENGLPAGNQELPLVEADLLQISLSTIKP